MRRPLHAAAEDCDVAAIELLVARGADVNDADDNGWTPLHVAVDAGIDGAIQQEAEIDLEAAAALIAAGAREDAADREGLTPRDVAACYGAQALALYDSISPVSWTAEPTLTAFVARCFEILAARGYDVRLLESTSISVARSADDHDKIWYRLFIIPAHWYGKRRGPGFREKLIACVEEGLQSLERRRNS